MIRPALKFLNIVFDPYLQTINLEKGMVDLFLETEQEDLTDEERELLNEMKGRT